MQGRRDFRGCFDTEGYGQWGEPDESRGLESRDLDGEVYRTVESTPNQYIVCESKIKMTRSIDEGEIHELQYGSWRLFAE